MQKYGQHLLKVLGSGLGVITANEERRTTNDERRTTNAERRTKNEERTGSAEGLPALPERYAVASRRGERTTRLRASASPRRANNEQPAPRAAFTIIELLVVICIVAILLGIALPSFLQVRDRARQRKAVVTAKHLELVFNEYYNQNQRWPGVDGEVKGAMLGALVGTGVGGVAYFEIGTNTVDNFKDPWNDAFYQVAFDVDFDNKVTAPDGAVISKSVIVWNVHAGVTNKSWE